MDFLEQLKDTHVPLAHFYLIEGASDAWHARATTLLEARGDVHELVYSTCTIEDAAIIRRMQEERNEKEQCIIIRAASVTHEAQQALLKAFEEPKGNTYFILSVPRVSAVLSTIQSRAQIISLSIANPLLKDAQEFIALAPEKRLEWIAKFIKSHNDDDSSGNFRNLSGALIAGIIEILRRDPKNLVAKKAFLNDAIEMRGYLDARGSSVKMILEHLALTL